VNASSKVTKRMGFVPLYRFRYTPWGQKKRDDSLATFARMGGCESRHVDGPILCALDSEDEQSACRFLNAQPVRVD
jgi:hypothetical protein